MKTNPRCKYIPARVTKRTAPFGNTRIVATQKSSAAANVTRDHGITVRF